MTIAEAIEASSDGDTVRLLCDVSTDASIGLKNDQTVDLGGYTLTYTGTNKLFTTTENSNSTYTLKNGSLIATKNSYTISFLYLLDNNNLTIENIYAQGKIINTSSGGAHGLFYVNPKTSSSKMTVIMRNCTAISKVYVIRANTSNMNWKLYMYNCDFTSANYAPINKNDASKKYDCIAYSGYFSSPKSESSFAQNFKVGENSYKTETKNGYEDTAIETTPLEFYVYEKNSVFSTMSTGASMRYNAPTGMRFYTTVDKDRIAELVADGATVTMGTLIAPSDLLAGETLTVNTDESKFIDVKFDSNEYYSDESIGFNGIVGSIANIKDKNTKRNFIGRGYIRVEKDGVTTVTYADFADGNIANNTRQIGWIASEIKKADATTGTSEYDTLSPVQKAVVNKYYNLYIA